MSVSFLPPDWVRQFPYRVLAIFIVGLVVYVSVRRLLDAGWLGSSDVAGAVVHRAVLIAWAIAVGLSYRAYRIQRWGKPAVPREDVEDVEDRELSAV